MNITENEIDAKVRRSQEFHRLVGVTCLQDLETTFP